MDQDWDLLAVVRGGNMNNNNNIMESSNSCFVSRSINQANADVFYADYPHVFETTMALDELEELYKPFYPVLHSPLSSPSTTILTSSISLPQPAADYFSVPQKMKNAKGPAAKHKKRKNQQKRVVKQVKEDGLCADMWAWRKYGQKPIKGSPYPRSYYRCSSSKGCSARKQVERSPSNPEIFIITYTAEHSHAHPTRRNSLAGSTRSKFPLSKTCSRQLDPDGRKSSTTSDHHDHPDNFELVQKESTKRENEEVEGESTNEIGGPNHDQNQMFPSLEELERGLLEELDEETFGKELIMDGEFLNQGFADDNHLLDHANWFFDYYSTTLTGAC